MNNDTNKSGIRLLFASLIALVGFGAASFLMSKPLEGVSLVVGVLIATVTDLKGFFWGTSSGSKDKDSIIANALQNSAPVPPAPQAPAPAASAPAPMVPAVTAAPNDPAPVMNAWTQSVHFKNRNSMLKIWKKANDVAGRLKNDLGSLVTKDEKLALINEAEKLAGHNGLGFYLELLLEDLKAQVEAQP
jgi:hypothetical protein